MPNIGRAQGGPTWQRDGITPHVRGIFDEQGRLMVMINWNTDIGDAWEWAESPSYPLRYSTYAIEITVNARTIGSFTSASRFATTIGRWASCGYRSTRRRASRMSFERRLISSESSCSTQRPAQPLRSVGDWSTDAVRRSAMCA